MMNEKCGLHKPITLFLDENVQTEGVSIDIQVVLGDSWQFWTQNRPRLG